MVLWWVASYYCSLKQSEDNSKSVERAKLELVKLDQQFQVSLDEYSKVREKNHHLDNKMQLEKAVSGEVEQSLKASIHKSFISSETLFLEDLCTCRYWNLSW